VYIPRIRAYDAEKGENILALAHKSLVGQRRSLESPPDDNIPTAEQIEEVRLIVAGELLSEYRASIEMDMFEEIDGYVVVNGPPANFAEVTDFWDHITPKVIKPLLESIAAAQGVSFDSVTFRPGDFNEPWTESGLRELAIHLAGRLRTAQIEALNDTQFLERTELDGAKSRPAGRRRPAPSPAERYGPARRAGHCPEARKAVECGNCGRHASRRSSVAPERRREAGSGRSRKGSARDVR
jgi:hypothetical protein